MKVNLRVPSKSQRKGSLSRCTGLEQGERDQGSSQFSLDGHFHLFSASVSLCGEYSDEGRKMHLFLRREGTAEQGTWDWNPTLVIGRRQCLILPVRSGLGDNGPELCSPGKLWKGPSR
jgi:hypothetical protein